jgi:hypothetical protein
MAETKHKKPAARQVFDVAKPGKSAPAPSGRPIIVSSGPIMKDPMVTSDGETNTESTPSLAAVRSRKVVVQPLSQLDKDDAVSVPGAPALTDDKTVPDLPKLPVEEVTDVPAEEMDETPADKIEEETTKPAGVPLLPETEAKEEEPAKPEEAAPAVEDTSDPTTAAAPVGTDEDKALDDKSEETSSDSSSIPDGLPLADGAATESLSESDQKEALAAQKLAEEQEKIIESGAYFLPIDAAHHKRSKRRFFVGLVVVLILLAVFALAAWDAELITIPGYTAPTNYL